ncbi:hypothetical protein BU23DRAFT_484670, partial [Bimuria novae-zelandiae CBS 107.79]
EARARVAITEQERQDEELEKAKMKELAHANKIYKEKIVEEKCKKRAREKVEQDQVNVEKRAAIKEYKAKRKYKKVERNAKKVL